MSGYRLRDGGVVDRSRPLSFTWDGVRYSGLAGDTLGSAMLANGLGTVARSFKYHRPRGIMSAGVEEAGALVTLGRGAAREPNAKAPMVELVAGLEARGQNAWPSVRRDFGQINDLLGRFFAAGFYYKTFFGITGRGTWEWMQFEKLIRRAAGLGTAADPAEGRNHEPYDIAHDHCDLAVVGAGPAGLAAAEAAATAGLDVMLIEQDFALGGSLIGRPDGVEGDGAADWIAGRHAALERAGARILTRATAFGLYDSNVLGVFERAADEHDPARDPLGPRGTLRIVRPARVILATGALERPMVCGDNDRPGVMLAGAMERYARRWSVAPGSRAVLATADDSAYEAAIALAEAGIETTLADARALPTAARDRAEGAGVTVLQAMVPVAVKGRDRVRGVALGRVPGGGIGPGHDGIVTTTVERVVEADCLGTSSGWSPVIHLVAHRGVRPVWDPSRQAFRAAADAEALPPGLALAGAADARATLAEAVADGRAAGANAAAALAGKRRRKRPAESAPTAMALHEIRLKHGKLKAFLDPQHDVTTEDVRLAAREGYRSVEHMKRYTTLGMATDQGKTGNIPGLALLADALGQSIPETGITTFRPPYTPVPLAAFAGRTRSAHWSPERLTPMHDAHAALGARFTDAGVWRRAWYYPQARPNRAREGVAEAYLREARVVRETCGIVDVSTLGKIDIQGPDAAEFLNRVYVNGFAKLPVGRARYGVMLRDDGIVLDDGVSWRLAEDRYLMTTTTAEAAKVMQWLEYLLAARWPKLRVHVASVTDQWGGVAVAGPRARAAIQRVLAVGDIANQALPFMGIAEGQVRVAGGTVPVLIGRVSFSGELAYELHAPAGWATAMWTALSEAVAAEGGVPYGLEALGALRIEKGHVTAAELDGRTTLEDAGLGRMASSKKPFIGSALSQRAGLAAEGRPQLVHIVPVDEGVRFSAGAILQDPRQRDGGGGGHGIGWVTGVTESPVFGGWLGIGFVEGGAATWEGQDIAVAEPVFGRHCRARVLSAHRLDPKGERMHA
ncbi:MAG: 2Fe-2S iron-sulfur cluster-binding protein [Pseudomonadota bacterium]